MKGFHRDNQLFSLCGLNCGLCPMHLNNIVPAAVAERGINPAKLQSVV